MDVRVLSTKLMGTDREWAEAVSRRAQEIFHKMKGNRFELDPNLVVAMTEGLSAAAVRDREFYKRIIKILENPNEESRHQMNLYDQADWDTFIEVVKGVKNIDPKTGKRIGLMLADHYHNLFQTVTELSNMEYWGNHASGDVENLSKAANFMQNQFAIEAYSDLHVEDMMQCYEMAIKVLRDSDGQWIDPSLAVFDPKSYNNFLDQLTIQFFKTRVQLGAVRDYVRDPVTGIPERSLDETGGRTLKRSDKSYEFEADEETRELRMLCSLRLAKGAYVLNNRAPELFAFTRTPGVDMEGYENKIPIFSSKVMGGLSRWDNPMSEWLLMYGFGDVLHKDFFNQLLGAHGSPEGRALTWSLDESIEAVDMLSSGDSEKFKARFGDNATRVLDMIEDFSFSGRHGPLSMWGTIDTTLNWTSKEYERLGGSIRISMVPVWVEKILKPEFEAAHKKNNWGKTHMGDQWYNATLGEGGWGEHNKWKERYDKYTRIYKTWIWTQTIMRNSTGVASHVWVDYKANDGMHHGKLRSKIFREIFTAEDLRDFKIEGQTVPELVVERDVASTGAMTEDKKDLLMRISIVDGDVGAVQRYAMNIGKQPENVTEVDFKACIKDDDNIKLFAGGKEVVITGKRRREQATDFWKKVQREMLGKAIGDTSGGWDFNDWHRELNPNWGGKKGEEISFGNTEQIDEIFNKARVASKNAHVEHRLTEDFVDKKIQIHFGTEDTQWSYLDMSSLGPRQWGRRWGDKLTRAKTTSLGLKHFDLIVGKPKMEDLIKSLQEMGTSEKGHDPKEAAKFAYVFGVATHNMYKQSLLAGFPLVGRLLPSLGIPMSIVQKRLGTDSGTYWSINNTLEFSEKLGETRVIPEKRIIAGRDFGPYTMERLRKDIGASKILAATEMFIIGYVIAAALTSLLAVKEGIEEDTGKRH
ncbi:hypothetical protein A2154_02295 [Candidatus Gottesmanbacteria bacterium RBG_16_43_7]|uniref:Uncharacterized protein n=1 Tax=Candidatus Gottesmanbacteria bacterium RBG_16_43_7 TaxID=1798373 RepID=A0A1F5ZAX9_9BACT|nr:MAG: hypothetical protein A2154_02295 [Candidatus Gottesmanbacteria bacterium RBG_16_43_7]